MHTGWHQLAYERDLKAGVNAITVEGRALLVVYDSEPARAAVYDGSCPHRGYLLGVAGQLQDGRVICPFHGQAVGLGAHHGCPMFVAQHSALLVGGLLFARIGADADCGFGQRIAELDRTHFITPGFTRRVRAHATLVIENAFDAAHFQPVHRIGNAPQMTSSQIEAGPFEARARFELPPSAWQGGSPSSVPFTTRAYSPTLVLTELGGDFPYLMLTATLPLADGACEVRLSVMVPAGAGQPPKADGLRYLLRQAEAGIEKDMLIWENLADGGAIRQAAPFDAPVLQFRRFCEQFA